MHFAQKVLTCASRRLLEGRLRIVCADAVLLHRAAGQQHAEQAGLQAGEAIVELHHGTRSRPILDPEFRQSPRQIAAWKRRECVYAHHGKQRWRQVNLARDAVNRPGPGVRSKQQAGYAESLQRHNVIAVDANIMVCHDQNQRVSEIFGPGCLVQILAQGVVGKADGVVHGVGGAHRFDMAGRIFERRMVR